MIKIKSLELLGKKLLETPLKLLPREPTPPMPPKPGSVRRILVVRPDERIGNLILLTPTLDVLKRTWPEARIDLLAGGRMAELLRGDPRLEEIVIFDKRRLIKNPVGLFALARRLRSGSYDMALDGSHSHQFSLTSALLTYATRARYRVGYLRGVSERLLNVGSRPDQDPGRHASERYLDLLDPFVSDRAAAVLHLPIHPDEEIEARRRLDQAGVERNKPLVGIHPGGRGSKRWPAQHFVDLARFLGSRSQHQVVLFHGPMEKQVVAQFPPPTAVVAPRLPLRLLAASIKQCRLFISGDTGPMHLAVAVGVPTLAIFLHSNYEVFGPRGTEHQVLYGAGGPDPDDVRRAAWSMLTRNGSEPPVRTFQQPDAPAT